MLEHRPVTRLAVANAGADFLHVVTWNISGCKPSAAAPSGWGRPDNEAAIASELAAIDADVVLLQECPEQDWSLESLGLPYAGTTSALSHCGWVHIFLHHRLLPRVTATRVAGPSVIVRLSQADGGGESSSVVLASCHLAPFKSGAGERMAQLRTIVATCRGGANPCVVIGGDMNMRDSESGSNCGLDDAWEAVGCPKDAEFTVRMVIVVAAAAVVVWW